MGSVGAVERFRNETKQWRKKKKKGGQCSGFNSNAHQDKSVFNWRWQHFIRYTLRTWRKRTRGQTPMAAATHRVSSFAEPSSTCRLAGANANLYIEQNLGWADTYGRSRLLQSGYGSSTGLAD